MLSSQRRKASETHSANGSMQRTLRARALSTHLQCQWSLRSSMHRVDVPTRKLTVDKTLTAAQCLARRGLASRVLGGRCRSTLIAHVALEQTDVSKQEGERWVVGVTRATRATDGKTSTQDDLGWRAPSLRCLETHSETSEPGSERVREHAAGQLPQSPKSEAGGGTRDRQLAVSPPLAPRTPRRARVTAMAALTTRLAPHVRRRRVALALAVQRDAADAPRSLRLDAPRTASTAARTSRRQPSSPRCRATATTRRGRMAVSVGRSMRGSARTGRGRRTRRRSGRSSSPSSRPSSSART